MESSVNLIIQIWCTGISYTSMSPNYICLFLKLKTVYVSLTSCLIRWIVHCFQYFHVCLRSGKRPHKDSALEFFAFEPPLSLRISSDLPWGGGGGRGGYGYFLKPVIIVGICCWWNGVWMGFWVSYLEICFFIDTSYFLMMIWLWLNNAKVKRFFFRREGEEKNLKCRTCTARR